MITALSSVAGRIRRNGLAFFLLAGLTVFCTAATVRILNADFKGEWTFNEQKSKLAEGRFRMNAKKIKVTQDADGISIDRTNAAPQGGEDVTTNEKVTFDGKTAESTVFGGSKKKSTAAWSADGNQLTINSTIVFERDGNSFEIKVAEVWKLADGGKTLSIDYTTTSQRGTSNNTFVYDKN
jgi:hypothetical protein